MAAPAKLRDDIGKSLALPKDVRWEVAPGLTDYPDALARMESEVALIAKGEAPELVWLVEHPPLYTAGTSAKPADLVDPSRFPVYEAGRGGQYTYHGPGQRVAYVMLDLRQRGNDVRAFVTALEDWIIRTLKVFGIAGGRREDRVGVWVNHPELAPDREDKIAAIGIRVRHGVSFHGISINLAPDLEHFSGIVPCGVTQHGVTSFRDLGLATEMPGLDEALQRSFRQVFSQQ
ncbi:MAG: lipoyl(octanoyl) transferase LipB [Hyphomicrobiales bacterium]